MNKIFLALFLLSSVAFGAGTTVKTIGSLLGTTDGGNACAGCVGEIISATGSSTTQNSPVNGTYYAVTGASISATAGEWEICTKALFQLAHPASGGGMCLFYSSIFKNGSLLQNSGVCNAGDNANSNKPAMFCYVTNRQCVIEKITATTTYDLRMTPSSISGTCTATSINASSPSITARRIR